MSCVQILQSSLMAIFEQKDRLDRLISGLLFIHSFDLLPHECKQSGFSFYVLVFVQEDHMMC